MRSGKRVPGKANSHLSALRLMRAVCHREEETYPIVYRAEVWFAAFVRRIELHIRSRRRAASCEQSLTAMFSDMFEANGLSIEAIFARRLLQKV